MRLYKAQVMTRLTPTLKFWGKWAREQTKNRKKPQPYPFHRGLVPVMYVILFRLFKIGLGVFLSPCYLTFFLIRLSRTLAFSVLVGCLPPFLASIVNVSHKEATGIYPRFRKQQCLSPRRENCAQWATRFRSNFQLLQWLTCKKIQK